MSETPRRGAYPPTWPFENEAAEAKAKLALAAPIAASIRTTFPTDYSSQDVARKALHDAEALLQELRGAPVEDVRVPAPVKKPAPKTRRVGKYRTRVPAGRKR